MLIYIKPYITQHRINVPPELLHSYQLLKREWLPYCSDCEIICSLCPIKQGSSSVNENPHHINWRTWIIPDYAPTTMHMEHLLSTKNFSMCSLRVTKGTGNGSELKYFYGNSISTVTKFISASVVVMFQHRRPCSIGEIALGQWVVAW
jgi:hypothetical protein